MDVLSFIIWLVLLLISISIIHAIYIESNRYDKKIKALEEDEKSIKDIVITVKQVNEIQPSLSPYQGSEWSASESADVLAGTAEPSSDPTGSCNVYV